MVNQIENILMHGTMIFVAIGFIINILSILGYLCAYFLERKWESVPSNEEGPVINWHSVFEASQWIMVVGLICILIAVILASILTVVFY